MSDPQQPTAQQLLTQKQAADIQQSKALQELISAATPLVQQVMDVNRATKREELEHELKLAEIDGRFEERLHGRLFPLIWFGAANLATGGFNPQAPPTSQNPLAGVQPNPALPGNNSGIPPTVAVNDTPPGACKKTLLPGSIDTSGRSAILQCILRPTSSIPHLSPSFFQYDITWHILG